MNNLHEKNNKNIVKMRDIETLKLKKRNKRGSCRSSFKSIEKCLEKQNKIKTFATLIFHNHLFSSKKYNCIGNREYDTFRKLF